MISRLLCLIRMHAWWYDEPLVQRIRRDHVRTLRRYGIDKTGLAELVRICSACPAKQKRIDGRWRWAT